MKTLTAYVTQEIGKLFLSALFFFSGMLILARMFDLLRLVIQQGAPLEKVITATLLWFPQGMTFAAPMSLLFAILIAYGQLAKQEELTAIRAAGLGPGTLLLPAMLLGAVLVALLILNETYWVPRTQIEFRAQINELRQQTRIERAIKPGEILALGQTRFSCKRITGHPDPVFEDVLFENLAAPRFFISARKAFIDRESGSPVIRFEQGRIIWSREEKHLSVQFEQTAYALPPQAVVPVDLRPKDRGILELHRTIAGGEADAEILYEFNRKLSVSLSPLFFAFFTATLSMLLKRGNRVVGFGLSLSILALYYFFIAIARILLKTQPVIGPYLPWAPNLVLLSLGYIFYRLIFVR